MWRQDRQRDPATFFEPGEGESQIQRQEGGRAHGYRSRGLQMLLAQTLTPQELCKHTVVIPQLGSLRKTNTNSCLLQQAGKVEIVAETVLYWLISAHTAS